jgi:hypothetical protein
MADKWTPDLPSPLVCKYSRLLTMTGNEALIVASPFARLNHRVAHKVFSFLFPSNLPFTHRCHILLAKNLLHHTLVRSYYPNNLARFSPVVSLALTKPRNSPRIVTLPPVHSTNLTHTETRSCVETSVASSPIKAKYLEPLHALTIFHVLFHC